MRSLRVEVYFESQGVFDFYTTVLQIGRHIEEKVRTYDRKVFADSLSYLVHMRNRSFSS